MKYLIDHYENLYKKYEDSHLTLQHANLEQQIKRYEIISSKIKPDNSILDFGCGLADLYKFLVKDKNYNGNYTGLEIVPSFINNNKKVFKDNKKVKFTKNNIYQIKNTDKFDYVLVCGTFNNYIPDINQYEYLNKTIIELFKHCKIGLSFNLLSTYIDYQDKNLFYFDPCRVFDFCKLNISKFIELKHDYILNKDGYPYEFTMHLQRSPSSK